MRIIIFALLFFYLNTLATQAQQGCTRSEIYRLIKIINQQHYQPKALDNVWSEKLFFQFLDNLDGFHFYFIKPDIKSLLSDAQLLDNQLMSNNLQFVEKIFPTYKNRLQRTITILENLKKKPLKLTAIEKFTPHHFDSLDYAENEVELSLRWEKYLKLNLLLREFQMLSDSTSPKMLQQEIFNRIIDKNIASVKNELQRQRSPAVLNYQFAKCIPGLFDAHSNYMSHSDFLNFQSLTSSDDFAFGITINLNKSGLFEIVKISPGSPAWKCNKLSMGDVITHLQWQDRPKIDIADLELEEVFDMMDESNNLPLQFTIRTITGAVYTVPLKKEKVNSEENFVKGFILTTANNKKYGYISLPSFYTHWETESTLGCANDVAKELIRLKKNNIEGLIFDLRNNGGGSLKEGLELSGIFINEGPIMIKTQRGTPAEVLKDWNRGTAYSGPMVVMINGHSASASELMASTLQDFNSAVIVGTDSYGKATGQAVLPLDSMNKAKVDSLRSGYASITMMKLYRVTGKSNQRRGVQPDIYLPDPYINLYEKESNEPEALPTDSIIKKVYYKPQPALPIVSLRQKSNIRVENNIHFQKIKTLASQDKHIFYPYNQLVDLNTANIQRLYRQHNRWLEEVAQHTKVESKLYDVTSARNSDGTWKTSDLDKEQEQFFIDKIKRDIFIEESFLILNDLSTK